MKGDQCVKGFFSRSLLQPTAGVVVERKAHHSAREFREWMHVRVQRTVGSGEIFTQLPRAEWLIRRLVCSTHDSTVPLSVTQLLDKVLLRWPSSVWLGPLASTSRKNSFDVSP